MSRLETPSGPGKGIKGSKTRQKVLLHAERILAEFGYDGFNIQEVVARSGVSVGSIYHHFGKREELIAAVLESFISEGIQDIEAMPNEFETLEESVEQLMLVTSARFTEHPGLYKAIVAKAILDFESWKPMRDLREIYDEKGYQLLKSHLPQFSESFLRYRVSVVLQASIALMTHISLFDSAPLSLGSESLINYLVKRAKETLCEPETVSVV